MIYPLHVSPTGGTVVVDSAGRVVAIAVDWASAASIVHALNGARDTYEPKKIDGLECVAWVKKYRNDNRVPLKVAKDEWDKRVEAQYGP